MSTIAIQVANLSKKYEIMVGKHRHDTLRDQISDSVHSLFRRNGRSRGQKEVFWALKDVSFEVKPGEVIGVIGRNGAGKSTLLKILSRITVPSAGVAEIRGRVGSLLEVGTGFHPELTGRENVYLNGAILGMKKWDINRKFDEIVAFAEINKFIDTPVKRYSSGMYVRLAFAVAAHLEPEILIIDEVLAVGDVAFQNKCLGKMDEVSRGGRTILFVSHNIPAVLKLCPETILLDSGQLVLRASSAEAIERYLNSGSPTRAEKFWSDGNLPSTCGPFRPIAMRVRNTDGILTAVLSSSDPFSIEVEYRITEPIRDLRVQIKLSSNRGDLLFISTDTDDPTHHEQHRTRAPGHFVSRCNIPANLLNAGAFVVGISAAVFDVQRYFADDDCLKLTVNSAADPASLWGHSRDGFLRPALHWDIDCLSLTT
jgi:homopolymeric O-antigen transport system ATP-binding protein